METQHAVTNEGLAVRTPVLVTGGTGTLGRLVVARLRAAGRDVRVLSRRQHDDVDGIGYVTDDLRKPQGIERAVRGVDLVVHCAGGPKGDDDATRTLVRAASAAGVQHLVYISVIGADRIPSGYFRSKLAAEQAIADSGVPWTTLRAAQFHDSVGMLAQKMAKLPVVPIPSAIRLQPVDPDEVAARLVELAFGAPAGLVPDLPGPSVYPFADLVRGYLKTRGKHRLMLPVRLPGKAGQAYRAGVNLSSEPITGRRIWEDFLAAQDGS